MYRVYSVIQRPKAEDYWLNIGAAFPHEDGQGFNLLLQALPLHGNGKLVLRAVEPEGKVVGWAKEKSEVRECSLGEDGPAGLGARRGLTLGGAVLCGLRLVDHTESKPLSCVCRARKSRRSQVGRGMSGIHPAFPVSCSVYLRGKWARFGRTQRSK